MSYKDEITQDIAEVMTDLQVQPILFIGSGISQRYFNAPSWKGLMKKLVEMCPELSNKRFAFYEQQFREGKIQTIPKWLVVLLRPTVIGHGDQQIHLEVVPHV